MMMMVMVIAMMMMMTMMITRQSNVTPVDSHGPTRDSQGTLLEGRVERESVREGERKDKDGDNDMDRDR